MDGTQAMRDNFDSVRSTIVLLLLEIASFLYSAILQYPSLVQGDYKPLVWGTCVQRF